jgi:hypothetical protein
MVVHAYKPSGYQENQDSTPEPLWKKFWRLLKNLSIYLPYDPAILQELEKRLDQKELT